MTDPKMISILIGIDYITIGLAIRDEELIDIILTGLSEYVASDHKIKIMQTHEGAQTQSKRIVTKIISGKSQMDEWEGELKQIFSVMRHKGRV